MTHLQMFIYKCSYFNVLCYIISHTILCNKNKINENYIFFLNDNPIKLKKKIKGQHLKLVKFQAAYNNGLVSTTHTHTIETVL